MEYIRHRMRLFILLACYQVRKWMHFFLENNNKQNN